MIIICINYNLRLLHLLIEQKMSMMKKLFNPKIQNARHIPKFLFFFLNF